MQMLWVVQFDKLWVVPALLIFLSTILHFKLKSDLHENIQFDIFLIIPALSLTDHLINFKFNLW